MYPPIFLEGFILFHSTMIDRYKKLVAVAEDMATRLNDAGVSVDGVVVEVEGHGGIVRIGSCDIIGSSYCSDDNVHHPVFGVDYRSYYFSWINGEWIEDEIVLPQMDLAQIEEANVIDELPF